MYRMPTSFGPSLGPRQGPGEKVWTCRDSPTATTFTVELPSDATALRALLPTGLELSEPARLSIAFTYQTGIDWLAGRGYNIVRILVPARYVASPEPVEGAYCPVVWENRSEPIITGREELGMAKIYAEIADFEDDAAGGVRCSASWDGFTFLELDGNDLAPTDPSPPSDKPWFHHKYVPATGTWGSSDADYLTMTPAEIPHRVVTATATGTATIRFHRATWEQLPTLVDVVNTFTDLPLDGHWPLTRVDWVGSKSYRDQVALR